MSERIDTDTLHVDDMHGVWPRAAGLDVHKMCITAAVRLCEAGRGLARTAVREFSALPDGLRAMTDWLRSYAVTAAAMEGTGVYWKAPFEALEDAGIHAELFHAQHVKQIRGKKTDVNDSLWLARICQFDLALPSYVPPRQFRQLRQLTRYRRTLVAERSRNRNRVHKTLDHDGLRLGGILFGLSGRNLLEGLVEGRDPEQMVQGVKGNARKKIPALLDALGQGLDEGAKPLVVLLRDMQNAVEQSLAALERRILEAVKRDYELPWTLLQTLPGTGPLAAAALLAEVGDDMDAFGSARRLASWAGMCPGNHESAGRSKGGKRRKGNVYLRRILCEIAHAAARTRDVQFGPYKQNLAKRRGTGKAVVATAHKILRIAFAMLRDGKPYRDLTATRRSTTRRRQHARTRPAG